MYMCINVCKSVFKLNITGNKVNLKKIINLQVDVIFHLFKGEIHKLEPLVLYRRPAFSTTVCSGWYLG